MASSLTRAKLTDLAAKNLGRGSKVQTARSSIQNSQSTQLLGCVGRDKSEVFVDLNPNAFDPLREMLPTIMSEVSQATIEPK